MRSLSIAACTVAFLVTAGEIARYWSNPRFVPVAFDELIVAAILGWAAWRGPQSGARAHLIGWGAFCGLMLVALIETAGHLIHGPAKANGPVYLAALAAMLALGLWALRRAWRLSAR